MSLQVQRVSNNDNRLRQKNALADTPSYYRPSTTEKGDTFEATNASKDGKFSLWEAAKNFGKGLISPITGMFSSKKNFLIGAGMIIGGAVLVAAITAVVVGLCLFGSKIFSLLI